MLLQVLDDGRLTDGQGRTVNFRNTVIVMTSDIGSPLVHAMAGQPVAALKNAAWSVQQQFRSAFLHRIDETVMFHALDAAHIASIATIQLRELQARVAKLQLRLQVSASALADIASVGFDPVDGARPLKRAMQQRIADPLSKLLLKGRFRPRDTIVVTTDPIQPPGRFSFASGAPPAPPVGPST